MICVMNHGNNININDNVKFDEIEYESFIKDLYLIVLSVIGQGLRKIFIITWFDVEIKLIIC